MWRFPGVVEVECKICGIKSSLVSKVLSVCAKCVKNKFSEALPFIMRAHEVARSRYGLPPKPSKSHGGIKCNICANECSMADGEMGFCGLRMNVNGKLVSKVSANEALMYGYYDPHVTNCCAAWFCPAGTGAGYPIYAMRPGPEKGYANYAVFFYGCNFDCLFCQNASHKILSESPKVTIDEFINHVLGNEKYTCICYFGGSPEPQLPFAINASRRLLEEKPASRILRICFEWNGCGNRKLVREAAEVATVSGGNIKFDLKCFSEELSYALSGVSNKAAYENFEMIAKEFYDKRSELPVLTATTLLVPGYVDANEVEMIAEFISSLNPDIPYSLLVFHPDHYMMDMPITPRKQVEECLVAARRHLKRVHVGNIHLLNLWF
ncbi:MAG: radical SAM protein [Candidatus Nezhaarchaeota archaeon]|nr:radical SAM protein [Candidatus Nezhaarchaeota archaeon]MCX8142289.1 radical SAM protein [Candidatus Nezhaarchaeota archaeon]MDW8050738.1 radical SAM protein [Nitrososphaerota archaeon]